MRSITGGIPLHKLLTANCVISNGRPGLLRVLSEYEKNHLVATVKRLVNPTYDFNRNQKPVLVMLVKIPYQRTQTLHGWGIKAYVEELKFILTAENNEV